MRIRLFPAVVLCLSLSSACQDRPRQFGLQLANNIQPTAVEHTLYHISISKLRPEQKVGLYSYAMIKTRDTRFEPRDPLSIYNKEAEIAAAWGDIEFINAEINQILESHPEQAKNDEILVALTNAAQTIEKLIREESASPSTKRGVAACLKLAETARQMSLPSKKDCLDTIFETAVRMAKLIRNKQESDKALFDIYLAFPPFPEGIEG